MHYLNAYTVKVTQELFPFKKFYKNPRKHMFVISVITLRAIDAADEELVTKYEELLKFEIDP